MEMLVTLVLAGLITTLLIQGLTHVLNLRIRVLSQVERQTAETLRFHWFQEVSAALTPDHPNGENVFSGDKNHFQGLTFAPLKGAKGVPTPVTMELFSGHGHILLQYREQNNAPWEIVRRTGNSGKFSYLDSKGRWHEKWPPSPDVSTQLPDGILLEMQDARGPLIWFAALSGRRDPKPRLKDLLGDQGVPKLFLAMLGSDWQIRTAFLPDLAIRQEQVWETARFPCCPVRIGKSEPHFCRIWQSAPLQRHQPFGSERV